MTTVLDRPDTGATEPADTFRFVATCGDLMAAFTALSLAVPSKSSVPVLGGVLVESDGTELVLTAFDFEVMMRVQVTVDVCTPGRVLVEHRSLRKTLTGLTAGLTAKQADGLPVEIRAINPNKPTMSVDGQDVPLKALPIEDYPTLPDVVSPVASVERDVWLRELTRVLVAAGHDYTLPALTGVRVSVEKSHVGMACTDRFRLTHVQVPATTSPTAATSSAALVPAQTLSKLIPVFKKLPVEQVRLGIAEDGAFAAFICGNISMTTRLLDFAFPSFKQLVPTGHHGCATVDRAALVRQTKRAAALAAGLDNADRTVVIMRLYSTGGVSVRVRMRERDDEVNVPVLTAAVDAGDRELWFNPKYLMEALASFDGPTISLFPTAKTSTPVLLFDQPDDRGKRHPFMHLLMPVRPSDGTAESK